MELADYWKVLRSHWLAIVVITLLGAGLGFGWALLQPRVYTADASGIVSVGVSSDLGAAMAGENYAQSRVNSYLDLASSRTVAEEVAESLALSDNPDDLVSRVSAENPLDTATLRVSAEADSPEAARDLAEAWVVALGNQVTDVENTNVEEGGEESIVTFQSLDAAQIPSSPTSPNTQLAVAIGLMVGFAAGVGYALLRNIFDRRIQSTAEVEQETGHAVLGTIPIHSGFTNQRGIITSSGGNDRANDHGGQYAVAEAMRQLRTNLQFMNVDNPPRSIVITSALPGEGKSIVTANLAHTIAAMGQRVVVVDGDLRRPTVAETFEVLGGVGLTDVLIGEAELDEVLQPWGDTGNLHVLGAGKVPPNPSELLGSQALREVINHLAQDAIVLIDAPPLLPVTDAAILTTGTDGALIVSRARRTTYDAVNQAIGNLAKVHAKPLGIIVNGAPSRGVHADSYGYHYRSYYGRKKSTTSTAETRDPVAVGK